MDFAPDLFVRVFEQLPGGAAIVAHDGAWLRVNRALLQMLEQPADTLIREGFGCFLSQTARSWAVQYLQQVKAGDPGEGVELRCQGPGAPLWVLLKAIRVAPERSDSPLVLQIEDITRRKRRVEDAEAFFALSPDLLAIIGPDGKSSRVSQAWQAALGWSAAELMERPYLDFVHPDDRERTRTAIEGAAAGRPSRTLRNRYRTRDGSYRWIAWRAHQAKSGRLFCIGRDITDERRREQALQLRDKALNATATGIFIVERQLPGAPIVYCNPAFERITGWSAEQVVGRPLEEVLRPVYPAVRAEVEAAIATQETASFRMDTLRADGRRLVARLSTAAFADAPRRFTHTVAALEDCTEQTQVEEALRARDLQLQQTSAAVPAVFYQWYFSRRGGGGFRYLSAQAERFFHVGVEDLLQDWQRLPVHPDDRAEMVTSARDAALAGVDWEFEKRLLLADGSVRWIRCRSAGMARTETEIVYAGVSVDVTQEHLAARALADSERRYKGLAEQAQHGIAVLAPGTPFKLLYANKAAVTIFGYESQAQVLALGSLQPLLPAELWEQTARGWAQLSSGAMEALAVVAQARHRDGSELWLDVRGAAVSWQGEPALQVTFTDVTHHHRAYREFKRLSSTDALTGLLNREAFLDAANAAFVSARESRQPLSIVVLDIERFKQLNRREGHLLGDEVLLRLAQALSRALRRTDLIARFGGDRFVMALPESDWEQTCAVIERLRELFAERAQQLGLAFEVPALRTGIAVMSDTDDSLAASLSRAEQALQQAKDAARDHRVRPPG